MHEFLDAIAIAATREHHELATVLETSARSGAHGALAGGVVHRSGDQIVDGAGAPITLRGVNLGGALLWESWIWGGTISLLHFAEQSERHIRAALASIVGAPAVATFAQAVYDRMIADDDFAAIAAHGFNVVRVPINHRLLADEAGFVVLDRVLDRAEAHGLYVVLDLHAAPGGQSKYFVADPDDELLWTSSAAQARTVELWRAIATRYRTRTVVAGYDLLNEPDPPDGAALFAIYTRIIHAIREVDSDHMIILEGADVARDFAMFSAPLDPDQIFSFHLYTWFGNDAAKRVARYAATAERLHAPMWCGEFGENTVDAIREQVELFDRTPQVRGWAFWTWKKVANRYPALHEIVASPSWRATIQWIAHP